MVSGKLNPQNAVASSSIPVGVAGLAAACGYDALSVRAAPKASVLVFGDELLTLRILTLSEREKAELRAGDERGRRLLERAEALTPEELMQMHGTLRNLRRVDDDRLGTPEGGLRS